MSDAATVVASLRAGVIGRALDHRPAGRPVSAVDACSPLDGFHLAALQLRDVLSTFSDADWAAPAHGEIGTVRDVVAHLAGVERLVLGWVEAPADEPLEATEHLPATLAASADLLDATPSEVARQWFDAAMRVHAACAAADPAKPVLAHDLPTDVDGLLVLRAFELWAHLQDVCQATGRHCPAVDEPRLVLMSRRLMGAVPVALFLRGVEPPPRLVRFVLTGRATGCFDVAIGGAVGDGEIDTTIVADTVDICRVAARRLAAAGVASFVEGDEDLADMILESLDAFARD